MCCRYQINSFVNSTKPCTRLCKYEVLAYLSWKLKWAFWSAVDRRPSVRLETFHIFYLLLKNHQANFNKYSTKHPLLKGSRVLSNEDKRLFPRGDYNEIAKIHWQKLKIWANCNETWHKAFFGEGYSGFYK